MLSTHVLDLARGRPAAGLEVELYRVEGERLEGKGGPRLLARARTNNDGRTDRPLLSAGEVEGGVYELVFHVGDYFRAVGVPLSEPAFLDVVTVRFGLDRSQTPYHVPLLVSPWGYTTYRGS